METKPTTENPNFETEQLALYLNKKDKRDLDIVKLFVANGADLEYSRILSNVCGHNHTEIFNYILDTRANKGVRNYQNENFLNMFLNESDPDEYRPVLRAFDNGHFDMFKTLINLGASFSFNDNHIAKRCIFGSIGILEFLHTNGLDLAFDDNYLLFHYVQNNTFTQQMVSTVDYLVKNGADLNGRNHTILSYISSMGLLANLTDKYADKFSEESIEKAIDIFYMNGYEKNLLDEIENLMWRSKYGDSLYETLRNNLPEYFKTFLNRECYTYKLKPDEINAIIEYNFLNRISKEKLSEILNVEDHDYYIPNYAIDKIVWTYSVKWPVKSLYKAWLKDKVNRDVQLDEFKLAFGLRMDSANGGCTVRP